MYRFRRNNSDNKDKWSRGAKLLINKEKHKPKKIFNRETNRKSADNKTNKKRRRF